MRRKVRRWLVVGAVIVIIGAILVLPRIFAEVLYPIPEEYNAPIDAAISQPECSGYDRIWLKALVLAVIRRESNFNSKARSRAGALGSMQIMPQTFAGLERQRGKSGRSALVLTTNVEVGTYYLCTLLNSYNGNIADAATAYNAGGGAANSFLAGRRTLSRETERYRVNIPETQKVYEEILRKKEQEATGGADVVPSEPEATGIERAFQKWLR